MMSHALTLSLFTLLNVHGQYSGGSGGFLVPPNQLYEGVTAARMGEITCGQPGEVSGTTTVLQPRHIYTIDFGASAADTILFTSCNHSNYDTGLSLWEWDPTEPWATYNMTKVFDNDDAGGCLGLASFTIDVTTIPIDPNKCYQIMVGDGDKDDGVGAGDYDIKMGCGSGTGHVTNCMTPSPTTSPTQYPTVISDSPITAPSRPPSKSPSTSPTMTTNAPSMSPTTSPTTNPTAAPTGLTGSPSTSPTAGPTFTRNPTTSPTVSPTPNPTIPPTISPTANPTKGPIRILQFSPPTTNPTMQSEIDPIDPTISTEVAEEDESSNPAEIKSESSLLVIILVGIVGILSGILFVIGLAFVVKKRRESGSKAGLAIAAKRVPVGSVVSSGENHGMSDIQMDELNAGLPLNDHGEGIPGDQIGANNLAISSEGHSEITGGAENDDHVTDGAPVPFEYHRNPSKIRADSGVSSVGSMQNVLSNEMAKEDFQMDDIINHMETQMGGDNEPRRGTKTLLSDRV